MFCMLCIHEAGECRHFVSFDLDYELASSYMLVFVLHEVSWEYGSDWCFGLHEDEELQRFEG